MTHQDNTNHREMIEVLKDLAQAQSVSFVGKETASVVGMKQYYLPALQYFIGIGERIDPFKIDLLLRENGVPEAQNKLVYKRDGTVLRTEGSYVRHLVQAILTFLKEEER